jgi:hypothetical protein
VAVESPVFERTCEELDQRSSLDRLEVRGTVRIGLKIAGLDAYSVDAIQMIAVLRKLLPREFETRGVANAAAVCEEVIAVIEGVSFEAPTDRAGAAAATMSRFGS